MRKYICHILAALMLVNMCFSVSVYAAASYTITAELNTNEKNQIVISGTVTAPLANVDIAMEVTAPGSTPAVVYADQTATVFKNGENCFEFAPFQLYPTNASGTYTVNVSGDRVGNAAPLTFGFKGAADQRTSLLAIVDAISAENSVALTTALTNNGGIIGLNIGLYNSLNTYGKAAVNSLLMDKTYSASEIPSEVEISTIDGVTKLQAVISALSADLDDALKFGQFNSISTDAEIDTWVTANGSGFAADDSTTSIDESKLYPYIANALEENEKLSARIAAKIQGGASYITVTDIRDILFEQSLLTIIENRHYSEGKIIFDSFPSLFGINTGALGRLDTVEQGKVYENVKGAYATYKAAGDAFNGLIPGSGGGSGRGNGGGGGGGFTVGGASASENMNEDKYSFTDLIHAEWARTAVEAMCKKNIISGYGDGTFKPNNNITRAEFIKILVVAVGIEMNVSAEEFADVPADAWYRPYVNAARAAGLITGDDNNCFNPNAPITREDMAVMIYRSYKLSGTDYQLNFNDAEDISPYAREAVAFLNSKGVINGIGNGIFAAKNNATRAQAAQMLYNIFK